MRIPLFFDDWKESLRPLMFVFMPLFVLALMLGFAAPALAGDITAVNGKDGQPFAKIWDHEGHASQDGEYLETIARNQAIGEARELVTRWNETPGLPLVYEFVGVNVKTFNISWTDTSAKPDCTRKFKAGGMIRYEILVKTKSK